MKVLFLTHIYPSSYDKTRGPYNLSIFRAISSHCDVRVMVPEPWWTRTRRPADLFRAPIETYTGLNAEFPAYWSLPRVTGMHARGMYSSLRGRAARLRKEFKFDAILAAWAYPDAVAASLLARDLDVPLVVNILGSDINVLTQIPSICTQIRDGLNRAHCTVTVSSALRDRVVEVGVSPDRVRVIHNGVDGDKFNIRDRAEARAQLGVSANSELVCYVGRLSHEKGIDVLVDSLGLMVKNGRKNLEVALIGGGDFEAELKARAHALNVSGSIRFLGMRPHTEVPQWITAADVMCLPSRREGCPNVVLESLASGRPVVASRVGGVPEILSDTSGRLVPENDPSALAAGIESALDSSWSPEYLRSCVESLSWQQVGDRYFAELEDAVIAHTSHQVVAA